MLMGDKHLLCCLGLHAVVPPFPCFFQCLYAVTIHLTMLNAKYKQNVRVVFVRLNSKYTMIYPDDSLSILSGFAYIYGTYVYIVIMHQSFVSPASPGSGNSGAFNFSFFKAKLKPLHCRARFVVKSLLKAPAPRRLTITWDNS